MSADVVVIPPVEAIAALLTAPGQAPTAMHRRVALDALAAAKARTARLRERPRVAVHHPGATPEARARYAAHGWQVVE